MKKFFIKICKLFGFEIIDQNSLTIISSEKKIIDQIYKNIIEISENRFVEKYSHEDQLFEISIVVNRIKIIIFVIFLRAD